MEVNKYTDIMGVVATQDIPEGRMVLITAQSTSHNFGSREDLVGIKLPANSAEAGRAKYVVAFALDNRPLPLVDSYPALDWAMRHGGWDRPRNAPFNANIKLTYPANDDDVQTVMSGSLALAFDKGVFSVTSGNFVYSASLVPGAHLVVANTADDGASNAGKLKFSASAGVAVVERLDTDRMILTFRTL